MNILWLCNKALPGISEKLGLKDNNSGGWLNGAYEGLKNRTDINLAICFPSEIPEELVIGEYDLLKYYAFKQSKKPIYNYDPNYESIFRKVINNFKPDIVHIWGTEYSHSLAMVRAFGNSQRTVISIQGLCSVYEKHYYAGLPQNIVNRFTFRDLVRSDNIRRQRTKFKKRGLFEEEALRCVNYVIGRTDWDKACTEQINPNVNYLFCNETLRNYFYQHKWNIDNCERHSIFVSQSNYPIKGFHKLIEAMPGIIRRFPDTKIYTTSKDIRKIPFYKLDTYNKYLISLIKKYELDQSIVFLGNLNEHEMGERYIRSHVFVSASSIENSPNSVGEAMLLGVPTVSSDVGGVKNLILHGKDGLIFPEDESYMLTHYVCKIFDDDKLATFLSNNAKNNAKAIYDKETNAATLNSIYNQIFFTFEGENV
ncbi:glycosyltransferase family 4 protein [Neobacillus sp. LXY-4]|uniref:glycosyltransferase family 4 protein n=1 Tax=Neobacillus sp. LXY-4 TaxID=3379826 RepID=UPI003EE2777F